MTDEITTEIVNALVDGKTEDHGERALILRMVRGFERGESSDWAMRQIKGFTDDGTRQLVIMTAVIKIINA
jgi:hypothetical protein